LTGGGRGGGSRGGAPAAGRGGWFSLSYVTPCLPIGSNIIMFASYIKVILSCLPVILK